MQQQSSGGKGILVLFMLVVIGAVVAFFVWGDELGIKQKVLDKMNFESVTNTQGEPSKEQPVANDWCKAQELTPLSDDESPARDRVLGWDIQGCCVREVSGYNCALHKQTAVKYCYTSQLGGKILFVSINDYFGDANLYKEFVEDVDKLMIPNKPCSIEKYPEQLKSEV